MPQPSRLGSLSVSPAGLSAERLARNFPHGHRRSGSRQWVGRELIFLTAFLAFVGDTEVQRARGPPLRLDSHQSQGCMAPESGSSAFPFSEPHWR